MNIITEEARKIIKEFAYESFDCGHIMNPYDYDLFARYCKEDNIEPSRELFELYYEYVDEAREKYYYKAKNIGNYLYDIYLDDLPQGNLVGNSGDLYFETEEQAQADADDYIISELSKEYGRPAKDFRVDIYKLTSELL